jgi:hypothetical protein
VGLKRLRLKPEPPEPEPPPEEWLVKAIGRLVKICNDRGYEVSFEDARRAWERYSESYCASWMSMSSDDHTVFCQLLIYLVCDEESEVAG